MMISLTSQWTAAPTDLILLDTDVHLWLAPLNLLRSRIMDLQGILAPEEVMRARNFHFEKDRERFIIARGLLRKLLGGYLKIQPESLGFNYGLNGKPALATPYDRSGIQFNLSHSRDFVLYGIMKFGRIGVDLEYIHWIPEVDLLVDQFFTAEEKENFYVLSSEDRTKLFFHHWTLRESLVKAKGQRMFSFDDKQEDMESAEWSFYEFSPVTGYWAALAVEKDGYDVSCWNWPEFNLSLW
jgi:4'-phosphopantetheinyl transferase